MRKRDAMVWTVVTAATLAACGSSTPKAARSSPAPTSTTMPSTSSGHPSSSTTGPGVGTTSRSADSTGATESVQLPIRTCLTTYGAAQPARGPVPASATVTVPTSLARQLAVYADSSDITRVLGPKGWSCTALYGADGSGGVAVYAPGEAVPTRGNPGPQYPPSSDEAITVSETGGSATQGAATACPYFAAAAASTLSGFGHGCPSPPPGETVTRIAADAVAFEDPPGVKGGGNPSGGPYPANGVVTYSAAAPTTYVATCTLPQSQHALCTAVLDYALALYSGSRPGAPRAPS